ITGTSNCQRRAALGAEHGVGQQQRHATAVVAVDVGDENEVDAVMCNTELVERDKARGAKINGEPHTWCFDENAGLEATARTERLSRPDKGLLERHAAPLSVAFHLGACGYSRPHRSRRSPPRGRLWRFA